GVVVTGLDAFEVDDAQAAEFAHLDAELHIGYAVHGAGEDRNGELDLAAVRLGDQEAGVHLGGVDGDLARHEGDLIESISDAGLAVASDPHSHNSRSLCVKVRAAAPRTRGCRVPKPNG